MRGAEGVVLDDTEYTLEPAGNALSLATGLAQSVSGGGRGEQPFYDVLDSRGVQVLTVTIGIGGAGSEGGGGPTEGWFGFETPDGVRSMVLEVESGSGLFSTDEYDLRDSSGATLATWAESTGFRTTLELVGPDGETAATASRPLGTMIRELNPFTRSETYPVSGPSGSRIARIRMRRSDMTSLKTRQAELELWESRVPPEVMVAFTIGVLQETSRSGSHGGGE